MAALLNVLKVILYTGFGFGVSHFAEDYVKPLIAPEDKTTWSPFQNITVLKVVYWIVCIGAGVLILKFVGKKLNVKILK